MRRDPDGRLKGVGTRDDPSSVVALTVIDAATLEGGAVGERTRVLVGVRSHETNPTHPGVVSVPTQRVPRALLDRLAAAAPVRAAEGPTDFLFGPGMDGLAWNACDEAVYAAGALMAAKLGVAEAVERRDVRFDAAAAVLHTGRAYYDEDPEKWFEDIRMANVAVRVTAGAAAFPAATAAYAPLAWVEAGRFRRASRERDTAILAADLDPFRYCIHGLCVLTADAVLGRLGVAGG